MNNTYWSRYIPRTIEHFRFYDNMFSNVVVVGLGALILNGLSYHPPEGNITVLTPIKEFDGMRDGIYMYQYIPDYDTSIGYEDDAHIPTPERAICNCLLYKEIGYHFIWEAIQFYLEDDELGDEEKIVETALRLGISEEEIREEIEDAKNMQLWE